MVPLGRSQALLFGVGLILVIASSAAGLLLLSQQAHVKPDGSSWTFYEIHDRTMVLHTTIRPCDEVESASARETDDHVEIALHVNGGGICADSAVDGSATVRLQAPLNGRPVYDASCLGDASLHDRCLRHPASDSG